jgi:hypothetical protein
MINIKLNELAHNLAIEECKRIYGEEAMYKNKYEEFIGLVLKAPVKITYNKMYNKYYEIVSNLKNQENEI